jgi:hypothetical protein
LLVSHHVVERGSTRSPRELQLDDDPFAGEDERWADEDWVVPAGDSLRAADALPVAFFRGLLLALALSLLGWLALAAAVYALVRLIG